MPSVRDVQNRVRSVDMALFPSVKKMLGEKQTFVYSLLAGFCEFASSDVSHQSEDVQKYAAKVEAVAQDCIREIESYGNQLDNQELKGKLQEKLNRLLFYAKKTDFEFIDNKELISQLQKTVKAGTYSLYKLPSDPERYYGGRIDIDDASFETAAKLLGDYQEEEDVIGSSFDHRGHITTIDPGELNKGYDGIVKTHEEFVAKSPKEVALKPVGIKVGMPQSGRQSKVVTIVTEVDGLKEYRNLLGLGDMKFAPHISVFSQEICPAPSLKGKDILDFTNEPKNKLISSLHTCFRKCFMKHENAPL